MKYYYTQTRDENGAYIRNGDWGIEDIESILASHVTLCVDDFAQTSPPGCCFGGVPCDWDEEAGEWVVDLEVWLDTLIRPERNKMLADTDKYVLPDYPISAQNLEQVHLYRQQLRDFPDAFTAYTDPAQIQWPKLII